MGVGQQANGNDKQALLKLAGFGSFKRKQAARAACFIYR